MALARIPDSGAGPERQGPRPKLTVPQIRAVRNYRRAGSKPDDIARMFDISVRSVYRYLHGTGDPVLDVVRGVVAQGNDEFGLGMTETQVEDVGRWILLRLRARGWVEGRPS